MRLHAQMIIFRYLMREVLMILLAIVVILLIIVLVSQLSDFLARIASGTLPLLFLGKLLLISIPILLGLFLPFAFYLALLLGYSRLYADSEMVVLQASGFSEHQLLLNSFISALFITAITGYLVLFLGPNLVEERGKILSNGVNNVLQTVIPGRFKVLNEGQQIIYVEQLSRDRQHITNIFTAQLTQIDPKTKQEVWDVSFAPQGQQITQSDGSQYLQLQHGYHYQGVAGQQNYTVYKNEQYSVLLPRITISGPYTHLDGMSSWELWQGRSNVMELAELEWRVSLTLQVLILMILAIPLSRVKPRQGRYAKFLPAILIYLVYVNLIFVARYLLEKGMVSPMIGLWWVHVLILIVALGLYFEFRVSRR
ncbi:MAG: LPS export ABC transporter permease LptF [Gammaproteobacteria bacterium]|nr:LPS export ABC transporter permease LptF [Gammaproteobacteria bacterium]